MHTRTPMPLALEPLDNRSTGQCAAPRYHATKRNMYGTFNRLLCLIFAGSYGGLSTSASCIAKRRGLTVGLRSG